MAQRRMFTKTITSSARFLKMPQEAQNLYFHLCMNADDDGVVEAFTIMQMLGSSEDNIRILNAKNLVKPLNEDMVAYITDWNEHNLIRADRKVNSIYKDLLLQILPDATVKEPKVRADTGVLPRQVTGRPVDNQWTAQVRLGKDRKGEVMDTNGASPLIPEVIKLFEGVNPACKNMYGNSNQRKASQSLIDQYGFDEVSKVIALLPKTNKIKYMPIITTPSQLWDKYQTLKDSLQKEKTKSRIII